ncbi:hypothetical protein NIES4073_56570 [Kalymmatonema gypsitolerans NIES-4073]|nr:hypothetical protein NIES4073_56570 [Scytonema sp. NIES-4073]
MHWTVAAPFINKPNLINEPWLTRNVPNSCHQFLNERECMPFGHNATPTLVLLGYNCLHQPTILLN